MTTPPEHKLPLPAVLICCLLAAAAFSCSKAEDINVIESDFVVKGQVSVEGVSKLEQVKCHVIGLDGTRLKPNSFTIDADGNFQFVVTTADVHRSFQDSAVLRFTTFTSTIPQMSDLSNKRRLDRAVAMIRYDCEFNPEGQVGGVIPYHQNMAIISKNSLWRGGYIDLGSIQLKDAGIRLVTVRDAAEAPVTGAMITTLHYIGDNVAHLWEDAGFGPVFQVSGENGDTVVYPLPVPATDSAEEAPAERYQILLKHEDYCTTSGAISSFDKENETGELITVANRDNCPVSDIPGDIEAHFAERHATTLSQGLELGYINSREVLLTITTKSDQLRPLRIRIFKGHAFAESDLVSEQGLGGFSSEILLKLPASMVDAVDDMKFSMIINSALTEEDVAAGYELVEHKLLGEYGVRAVASDASQATIMGPGDRQNFLSALDGSLVRIKYENCPTLGRIALIDEANLDPSSIRYVECSDDFVSFPVEEIEIAKDPGLGGFRNLIVSVMDQFGNISEISDDSIQHSVYFDYGIPDLTAAPFMSQPVLTNLGSFGVALKTDAAGTDDSPFDFDADGFFISEENLNNLVFRTDRPSSCKLTEQTVEDGAAEGDLGHYIADFAIAAEIDADNPPAADKECGADIPLQTSFFKVPTDTAEPVSFMMIFKDYAGHESEPATFVINRCFDGDVDHTDDGLCWCDAPVGANCPDPNP